MKDIRAVVSFAFLITLLHIPVVWSCDKITIGGHPDFPPLIWSDKNRLYGVSADIAVKLLSDLNIAVTHHPRTPYKRVQHALQNGTIDLVVLMAKNQKREQYAYFLEPSYASAEAVIWSRTDAPAKFGTINDLSGLRGILRLGSTYGSAYDTFFDQQKNIMRMHDMTKAFKMLANKQTDYVVYDRIRGQLFVDQGGWSEKIQVAGSAFPPNKLYLALSKKSPCVPIMQDLSDRLNNYMKGIDLQEMIERNIDRYLTTPR